MNDKKNSIQLKEKLRRSSIFVAHNARRGFTLAEILVAVAIMGVVVAGVTTAIVSLFQNQAGLADKNEANEFIASFSRFLQTETSCSLALQGIEFPVGNTTGREFTIKNYNGAGVMLPPSANGKTTPIIELGKNTMIAPRVRISKLIIRDKGIAPIPVKFASEPANQYIAQVEIETEQRTQASSKGESWTKMRPRFIEFPVVIGAAGAQDVGDIRACQIEGELENACTLIGGVYDPKTQKCVGNTQCQLMGTYYTSVCEPSYSGCKAGQINAITKTFSCPAGSVASESGRLVQSFSVRTGKKGSTTIRHTMRFFVCMQCNENQN